MMDVVEWTTDKPTEPGYYWVYIVPKWEKAPTVECAEVYIYDSEPLFYHRVSGHEWEADLEVSDVIAWMGPLVKPDPPRKQDK